MSLFAIADLHLSFGSEKPMDVFRGWENYTQRLKENWEKMVAPEDTVVVAGDISWAMHLSEAAPDFEFIHKLPGIKIIIKGNHDYWFETKAKTDRFFKENGFDSVFMLFNNAFECGEYSICGTRGWFNEKGQNPDKKILMREAGRLKMSLDAGEKFGKEPLIFLHYPPVFENDECREITEIIEKSGAKRCFYGHLHGEACKSAFQGVKNGVEYRMISCDYVQFAPVKIF